MGHTGYSRSIRVADQLQRELALLVAREVADPRVGEVTVSGIDLSPDTVIYEGELESLRRFQDDVSEVRAGTECGIGVRNYNDVKVGDQIEVYERIQLQRTV